MAIVKKKILLFLGLLFSLLVLAEDGYRLWLRYDRLPVNAINSYRPFFSNAHIAGNSPTLSIARDELQRGISGLLGLSFFVNAPIEQASFLAGTAQQLKSLNLPALSNASSEAFSIITKTINGKKKLVVYANSEIGVLYGVFELLRLLQTTQSIQSINIVRSAKLKLRMLNHWDNLNRTVERGYAGFSIWNWHTLPSFIDQRYIDYARANASIGINAVSLTNVNANATVLTRPYLEKVAALADLFRPYGIKVFLTARFSAPIEIGGLKTADPLDTAVRRWWFNKADEIYSLIPDFGGFLVKANSEGQPGPQNYQRNHADGANLFADALALHNGIVIWRAFVYSNENPDDRHKQAYDEFKPLDGTFRSNVMIQVKNGAIDFQPREPFHPLFGAMPKTPLMMEFQLTQEYLGQATSLVYLAPLFKECLESDTYTKGPGTTVTKIIEGETDNHVLNGMAGVANIGNDINWCGHPFAQSNWYALGRLAWDPGLSSEQIADEWLRMSYSNDKAFIDPVKLMMLRSREILVQYMTPLGLHHIMGTGHHYGPAPWISNLSRPEWNPVYYHRADSNGIGFNRTATGTNALQQYAMPVQQQWSNPATTPEKYLLWFHHLSWDYRMKSGRTLWEEICYDYNKGLDSVHWMQNTWSQQKIRIDSQRFNEVTQLLSIQEKEASWWRNACLLYFQTFSKRPLVFMTSEPDHTLEYYKQLRFPYAPGN